MSEFADLLARAGAGARGDSFKMRCPSHDDTNPSLQVTKRADGSAQVKCWSAGCDPREIRKALGLSTGKGPSRDSAIHPGAYRIPNPPAKAPDVSAAPVVKKLSAEYPYHDQSGVVLATKCRYEPKGFGWTRVDDSGTKHYRLDAAGQPALPLYRLPEVLDAVAAQRTVWMAEGEKDANNLAAIGITATTNPEGAGVTKWPEHRLLPLTGADVLVLPDNDPIGFAYGDALAAALLPLAASVRVLHLPGLLPKGDVSDWLANGGTREALETLADNVPPMRPIRVRDGAAILDDLVAAIKRYVVLSDDAAVAAALWVLHTHCFAGSHMFTGYLAISAPTRAAGKTTLLDILSALVARPHRADSISAAALFRRIDCGRGVGKQTSEIPTVFLDELDAVFGNGGARGSEKSEGLRGVLNSGFRKGGTYTICVGEANAPTDFHTWSPKALCGIGKSLPDTVADRSIPIALSRATVEELKHIEKAHHTSLAGLAPLHAEAEAWAVTAVPILLSTPEPNVGLSARQSDIWGPLLNIADLAGSGWGARARAAAHVLHADNGDSTDGRDPGSTLLSDMRDLFDTEGPSIRSARLAELLRLQEDSIWPEYSRGGPVSTHAIARLLRPYGISPVQERIGGDVVRAYFRTQCEPVFMRYLPPRLAPSPVAPCTNRVVQPEGQAVQPVQSRGGSGDTVLPQAAVVPLVPLVPLGGIHSRSAVPTAPTAPTVPGGMPPLSFLPDPDGLQPLPF